MNALRHSRAADFFHGSTRLLESLENIAPLFASERAPLPELFERVVDLAEDAVSGRVHTLELDRVRATVPGISEDAAENLLRLEERT